WGVSESAYNARDLGLTYQYSNFGVPGLGLKRGLGEGMVIAPYAPALAAMIEPDAAAENLQRLAALGAQGAYGFYEALDYTGDRLPGGRAGGPVRPACRSAWCARIWRTIRACRWSPSRTC